MASFRQFWGGARVGALPRRRVSRLNHGSSGYNAPWSFLGEHRRLFFAVR